MRFDEADVHVSASGRRGSECYFQESMPTPEIHE